MTIRSRAKLDANQPAIVAALRKEGYVVLSLAPIGRGVPDLLVCDGECYWLLEVKASGGTLTPAQVDFINTWPAPVRVVYDVESALQAVLR